MPHLTPRQTVLIEWRATILWQHTSVLDFLFDMVMYRLKGGPYFGRIFKDWFIFIEKIVKAPIGDRFILFFPTSL